MAGDFVNAVRFLFVLIFFTIWLFLFCFFGDEVSVRFIEVNDAIYDCCWHQYPIELRQYFPFIMRSAQNPIYMR